jgi:hypothetical protein
MAARDALQALKPRRHHRHRADLWCSLTVHFDPLRLSHEALRHALLQAAVIKSRRWRHGDPPRPSSCRSVSAVSSGPTWPR